MTMPRKTAGVRGTAALLLAASALAVGVPTAVLAVPGDVAPSFVSSRISGSGFAPFTPANIDPQLAKRVAARIAARGQALFTPAGAAKSAERTVTVAVRVDDRTARAITVRSAVETAKAEAGAGNGLAAVRVTPARYNLGAARGYQSFAKPAAAPDLVPATELKRMELPDLAQFKPGQGIAEDKPSRFQPRVAFEEKGNAGRAPRTLEGLGEQSVDVGGSYRVLKNLDVTAGVRVSQDRDRLTPLTDGVQDSQAVYVGTQFKF